VIAIRALPPVDSVEFFEALAAAMRERREEFERVGWCDLDLEVVVLRPDPPPFRVLLRLRGYGCEEVRALRPDEHAAVDCTLEGELAAFEEMLEDILAHGSATGRHTVSSLVLLGDRVRVRGDDPVGVDRFFRCAETIQRFFDGAGSPLQPAASPA
jgi:hypothetical protein